MKTISKDEIKRVTGAAGLYVAPPKNQVIYVRPGNAGLRVPGVTYVYSAQPGSVRIRG